MEIQWVSVLLIYMLDCETSHVHPLREIRSLAIHRSHVYMLPERLQLTFRLKTWCKWRLLWLNFNVAAHGHLDYTTRAGWRHFVFVLCSLFYLLNVVTVHSIMFCELKIFSHPHISIEVSTYRVDYSWMMEYRFKHVIPFGDPLSTPQQTLYIELVTYRKVHNDKINMWLAFLLLLPPLSIQCDLTECVEQRQRPCFWAFLLPHSWSYETLKPNSDHPYFIHHFANNRWINYTMKVGITSASAYHRGLFLCFSQWWEGLMCVWTIYVHVHVSVSCMYVYVCMCHFFPCV